MTTVISKTVNFENFGFLEAGNSFLIPDRIINNCIQAFYHGTFRSLHDSVYKIGYCQLFVSLFGVFKWYPFLSQRCTLRTAESIWHIFKTLNQFNIPSYSILTLWTVVLCLSFVITPKYVTVAFRNFTVQTSFFK